MQELNPWTQSPPDASCVFVRQCTCLASYLPFYARWLGAVLRGVKRVPRKRTHGQTVRQMTIKKVAREIQRDGQPHHGAHSGKNSEPIAAKLAELFKKNEKVRFPADAAICDGQGN